MCDATGEISGTLYPLYVRQNQALKILYKNFELFFVVCLYAETYPCVSLSFCITDRRGQLWLRAPIGELDPVQKVPYLQGFWESPDDDFLEKSSMKLLSLRLRMYKSKPSLFLICPLERY